MYDSSYAGDQIQSNKRPRLNLAAIQTCRRLLRRAEKNSCVHWVKVGSHLKEILGDEFEDAGNEAADNHATVAGKPGATMKGGYWIGGTPAP